MIRKNQTPENIFFRRSMKNYAVLLGLFFFIAFIPIHAQYLTNGLIAYYPFENNANDSSGNGYHGQVMNNPIFVNAKFGKGIVCTYNRNNTDDKDTSGAHAVLSIIRFDTMKSFAISLWVLDSSLRSFSGSQGAYIFYGKDGNGCVYIFHGASGIIQVGVNQFIGNTEVKFDFDTTKDRNHWVHYVLNYKDSTVFAYRNGVLKGSAHINSMWPITDNYGAVGRHWWEDNGIASVTNLNCVIDEVRIYNRALDSCEIEILSHSGATITVGNENNRTIDFSLAPNPSIEKFVLHLPTVAAIPRHLKIVSTLGELVYTNKIMPGLESIEVSTSSFSPGLYMVSVDGIAGACMLQVVR